jgi:hypothetical protein
MEEKKRFTVQIARFSICEGTSVVEGYRSMGDDDGSNKKVLKNETYSTSTSPNE